MKRIDDDNQIVTKSMLISDMEHLGISQGQVIMLHAKVSAIGWVVGGPDMVLQSITKILTAEGTLMMFVSWEDNPSELSLWPEKKQQAYLEECPPFNPLTSRADRNMGILTEYLRTLPGAHRSGHPEASFASFGKKAQWITDSHPVNYGYGAGSPLEKLCESDGKVLMLGTSFDTTTVLHYAEYLADLPEKRIVHYKMPVLENGKKIWVNIKDYDTAKGIVDWHGEDYFALIGRDYISSGKGIQGKVGQAHPYLIDAADLVKYGIRWMEMNLLTKSI